MIQAIILMLVLGAILGLGLGLANKFLHVEVDARVETVTSMLPGYNCGSCGYPGCSGMAEALVSGEVKKVGTCRPCKPDRKQEIVDYLNSSEGPNGEKVTVTA